MIEKTWDEFPFRQLRPAYRTLFASAMLVAGLPDVDFSNLLYARLLGGAEACKKAKNPTKQKMVGMLVYWYTMLQAEAQELPKDHAMQTEIMTVLKQFEWVEPFTKVIVR